MIAQADRKSMRRVEKKISRIYNRKKGARENESYIVHGNRDSRSCVRSFCSVPAVEEGKKHGEGTSCGKQKKDANIAHLYRHAEELAEIKRNSGEEYRRLEDAKTDEEIAAVVDAVVAGNNGLCDGGKKRDGASSEAGEKETGAAGKH